jgi:hypothetical protein
MEISDILWTIKGRVFLILSFVFPYISHAFEYVINNLPLRIEKRDKIRIKRSYAAGKEMTKLKTGDFLQSSYNNYRKQREKEKNILNKTKPFLRIPTHA